MARIFITGDTHRDLDWGKLSSKSWPEQKDLTKDDFLIVLGDFGVLWEGDASKPNGKDRHFVKWYENKPFTTLWIDGNHENHAAINEYPVEEWHGGKIHRISNSVIHLMRGQVYNIAEKTFFTMGGASSIDRAYRKENVSWWPQEMPSFQEMEEAFSNLEAVGWKVNYVLSHDCGAQILGKMYREWGNDGDPLRRFLFRLESAFALEFDHWYFGHHHLDADIDDKHTAVYDNIIELPE